MPIRLSNSPEEDEGDVQVFYHDSWENVCFNSWGINEANVVCRMLGYEGASAAFRGGRDSAPGVLEWVQCNGTERNLAHCNMSDFEEVRCPGMGLAAARCFGKRNVFLLITI